MAMHTAWIKNLSPYEAKERRSLALFATIIFTVVCVGNIGSAVLDIVLQKILVNKIISAFYALFVLALIPLVWQIYFCFKKRAAESDAPEN